MKPYDSALFLEWLSLQTQPGQGFLNYLKLCCCLPSPSQVLHSSPGHAGWLPGQPLLHHRPPLPLPSPPALYQPGNSSCTVRLDSCSKAMVAGVEVPGDTAMAAPTSPVIQLEQLGQMAGAQGWGELLQQVIFPNARQQMVWSIW